MEVVAIVTQESTSNMDATLIDNEKASRTTRILIVDDEPVVVRGLKQILGAALPTAVLGQAEVGRRALDLLREQSWDVFLLVCDSWGDNGLALMQKIRRASPQTPVLVVGSHSESECALCAIRAGASGWVTKKTSPEELAHAIRQVTSNGCYISPAVDRTIAGTQGEASERPPQEMFSGRELQVLVMILAGKTLKGIAFDLALSVKTIGTYRTRIFQKLGITTDIELARYAMAHGLICRQTRTAPNPSHCPQF